MLVIAVAGEAEDVFVVEMKVVGAAVVAVTLEGVYYYYYFYYCFGRTR